MGAAVGAVVGTVSTISGIASQGAARKAARQQAEVQKYAQEVQYQQQLLALDQQKEFRRQQQQLESYQLDAQDAVARDEMRNLNLQNMTEETQAEYQLKLQSAFNEGQTLATNKQLAEAELQRNMDEAARMAAASTRLESEGGTAIQGFVDSVAKYLQEGDNARAAQEALMAANMQQDSLSSQNLTDPLNAVADTVEQVRRAGQRSDRSFEQFDYESVVSDIASAIAGNNIAEARGGARTQDEINKIQSRLGGGLLESTKARNRLNEGVANRTLEGAIQLRNQQRNIDSRFSDLGHEVNRGNAGAQFAAQNAATQAQINANKPSFFTTLSNAAAIGGSIYNSFLNLPTTTPRASAVSQNPPFMRMEDTTGAFRNYG